MCVITMSNGREEVLYNGTILWCQGLGGSVVQHLFCDLKVVGSILGHGSC